MPQTPEFKVALRGDAILNNPRFNKGTAFTHEERDALGLDGRLPFQVNTLDKQCARAYDQFKATETPIHQNSFLQSLKDQNWVLYYRLISTHLREMIPVIYTPTEAEAIANYSHLFRKSDGLFLTYEQQHEMEEDLLEQTKNRDIQLIVCSDAEAILGIGDQGVGGIGIATAKSAIYTLIAGINPANSLSVALDVGTDNESLLTDPLYVGWPHKRVRGEAYYAFMDKFIQLVRKHHPHSLLHFEDFGVENAGNLLDIYQCQHAVFNDDIQGTGAVTLAAVIAATGVTKSKLSDQRYIVYGAGSAGLGITRQLRDAIVKIDGVPVEQANHKFFLIDRFGLVKKSLGPQKIRKDLHEFVRPDEEWNGVLANDLGEIRLLEVVKKIKPTVLIGCSTHAGGFTKEVVEAMAAGCERPIILPLSNPTRLVEVNPKDAINWSGGKALLATGSPFPPVRLPNGKDYTIAECNNALVYPGLGFGAVCVQSRKVTDKMIITAAKCLASLSPALSNPEDALLPDFADSPAVNFEIAVAVAEDAIEEGQAGVNWTKEEARDKVKEMQWKPIYGKYVYDKDGEC